MVVLNHRRLFIIKNVSKQQDPITVSQLAEELDCSERTLRMDLEIVDDWLIHHDFSPLLRTPNIGITLEIDQQKRMEIKNQIRSTPQETYEFNRNERVQFILLILLTTPSWLTITKFEKIFSVSRGSIHRDLQVVESLIQSYNLSLCKQPRKGIWIEGSEVSFRQALTYLCKRLDPVLMKILSNRKQDDEKKVSKLDFSTSMAQVVDRLQVEEIQRIVEPLLQLLNIQLSDDGQMSLYLHIGIAIKRLTSKGSMNLKSELKDIYVLKEFKIAELLTKQIESHFQIKLPAHEVAYIALRLLGNQSAPLLPENKDVFHNEILKKEILNMTLIIERQLNVKFQKRKRLIKGLLLHMSPAIYRARYGLRVENELVYDVQQEFSDVYNAVKGSISNIEKEYQITFSEEELAYITMHYGGSLPDIAIDNTPLTIMIICSSGIGTANLLKTRIEKLFHNIQIKEILSYHMFMEREDWEVDLIVSTINIQTSTIPVLTVNPLLPDEDYNRLSLYAQPKEKAVFTSKQFYEAIWPILTEHCIIKDSKQLTESLLSKLQTIIDEKTNYASSSLGSLDGVLLADYIQLDVTVKDWQEAIYCGTKPLEEAGVVSDDYKSEIVKIINERGPYMAVAKGIMLAHGSVKKEADKVSLSLTRFDPPIAFGHEKMDPISLLFVFVSPDKTSHVPALQQLLEHLIDEDLRKALALTNTVNGVLKLFTEH